MDDLGRCYLLLGIEPGASAEEIKEAWRDLVQVWHPDRFPANERLQQKAQEKLKLINQAYEKLRTPQSTAPANGTSTDPAYGYQTSENFESELPPLEVLGQGVNAWNLWRKRYSNLRPNLQSANLNGKQLGGIDLRETNLSNATLQDCDLYKANLSEANATALRLQRSDLSRALLHKTNLRLADLTDADLSGADLSGSVLTKCRLAGTNLMAANFCGADLTDAIGLAAQQMAYTITDYKTRLPAYL